MEVVPLPWNSVLTPLRIAGIKDSAVAFWKMDYTELVAGVSLKAC
jgi:hypothetical protein